jgi:hypothetical protein
MMTVVAMGEQEVEVEVLSGTAIEIVQGNEILSLGSVTHTDANYSEVTMDVVSDGYIEWHTGHSAWSLELARNA